MVILWELGQQLYSCSVPEMFFGNPELLQRNLHNDLNTLIKNVKSRQDQFLTILQYNKTLITNNMNPGEHIPFFNEQLNKHKSFLSSSQSVHEKMLAEEDEIREKYCCAVSADFNVVKLLGRVTARVLEICQVSMEKGKFLDPGITDKYNQFKSVLLGSLNQGGKINIQTVLDTIIEYTVGKDKKQLQRLQQILKIITDGDMLKLTQIYTFAKQQQKKPLPPAQKKQPPKSLPHPSPQKPKQKSPQKHQRQQQQRLQNERIKKKKTKVTKDLITNVYSIMDLSKQQFLDDFTFTLNPEEKRRRLYEEIFSRNRFNYEQIMDFQAKKDSFELKVREFKEMMELESKRIQQALVVVINKPIQSKPAQQKPQKVIQRKQTKSDVDQNQNEQEQSISPERVDRIFRRRQKKQSVKAPSPRFAKQIAFSSMQSTQEGFQHIKFDVKNEEVFTRSNRARLPQIPGRSSLDNRYQRKNESRIGMDNNKKDQKRISIMKNVQIGTLNSSTAKNSFIESNSNSNRKSPRDRSLGQPLFQNLAANLNMNANGLNGLDFTFYVRKKVNKFYETRNNFVL